MYFIMAPDTDGSFLAKAIATAATSTQARRLACDLDTASVGRLFYLDQDSYTRWRSAGRVCADEAIADPEPALPQPCAPPA
jgi:hypothetical protein